MKLLNYKAIIFDFDGVIAESVNVKTEAFSKIYLSQFLSSTSRSIHFQHIW